MSISGSWSRTSSRMCLAYKAVSMAGCDASTALISDSHALNPFRNLTPSCYVFVTRKCIWDKLFFLIFNLPSSEELDTDMKRAFQALSGATRRIDACSTFNVIFVFKHGLLF